MKVSGYNRVNFSGGLVFPKKECDLEKVNNLLYKIKLDKNTTVAGNLHKINSVLKKSNYWVEYPRYISKSGSKYIADFTLVNEHNDPIIMFLNCELEPIRLMKAIKKYTKKISSNTPNIPTIIDLSV